MVAATGERQQGVASQRLIGRDCGAGSTEHDG